MCRFILKSVVCKLSRTFLLFLTG